MSSHSEPTAERLREAGSAAVPLTDAEEQYPLQPSVLDPSVYTDPAQYERELALIFRKS